jgi:general secretion pathway protein M
MTSSVITRMLAQSPLVALVLYVAVGAALLVITGSAISDIARQQRALAQTSDLLDRLRGGVGQGGRASSSNAAQPGIPFLEGPTVTVAGAALLQRVAAAVSSVGGTIQSSQVDVSGAQAKVGFVSMVVSCEVEQAGLQKLLYDLEVGMPFLFVDQLDVQVPHAAALAENGLGRIRVILGVSGQWQPTNPDLDERNPSPTR